MDAILALRLLSELHHEFCQPLSVAYVDLKAALDSVDRIALRKALQGIGVPDCLLTLIKDLQTNTSAKVHQGRNTSKCFPTRSGARQGCILASSLFYGAMDWTIGQSRFSDMDYADDVALVSRMFLSFFRKNMFVPSQMWM